MNLVNGPATVAMLVTKPFALPAFTVSALVCALVVRSAVRTLRVATVRAVD